MPQTLFCKRIEMSNQENQTEIKAENLSHEAGVRTMYVIERDGLYFKGYNQALQNIEFTSDIMQARMFTHTRAAHPRSGERILTVLIPIAANSLKILS